jgi:CRP/FNR family transcriptional regulator, cyclic AMP receptor protein
MATPVMVGRSVFPRFAPWPESQTKAKTPYGLPIVDHCVDCQLRCSDFFCGISQTSMKGLDQIKHITTYPAGALLMMEGQKARGVYILCQGRVKLLVTNSDGRTLILKIARAGEVLGLNSAVTGRPNEVTVETLQPSQVAFIGREDFLRFIKEYGDACLHVAQHLGRDCQAAYGAIRAIGLSHSVGERLARFLLEWTADGLTTNGVVRAKLALTHEEIAQLIGSSRETVTRALSELRKQRIAEMFGSTLLVRNKPALEGLAGD